MSRFLRIALALASGCSTPGSESDRAAILGVLTAQAEAWNRGDLDRFLRGYWRSEKTVFAGGGQVHHGFDAMAERYRKTYPTKETMGRLTFSQLAFEQLESDRAVITGSWELQDTVLPEPYGGVFTLLFRRLPEGWRIVHDHTSQKMTK